MKFIRKNLNEALLPSTFRRYVKHFNRERYKDIFSKYEGDRNKYRIYLPLDSGVKITNPINLKVEEVLDKNGYDLLDYTNGVCKFRGAKNPSKVGKVLNSLIKDDPSIKELLDKFNSDNERKSGKSDELMIVISRHPYDIAGADTDRKWTNCMTLSQWSEVKQEKILKLRKEILKLRLDLENIQLEKDEIEVFLTNLAYEFYKLSETEQDDYDYEENEEMEYKLDELNDEYSNIEDKVDNLERELEELEEDLEHGSNTHYLIYDVKEGSLSAFLVKKSDKNINDPKATLNIKPFISDSNPDDIILVSDKKPYGEYPDSFKTSVDKWLDEVNGDRSGIYCLNPKLYNDGLKKMIKISKESINNLISSDKILRSEELEIIEKSFKSGEILKKDIKNIWVLGHLYYRNLISPNKTILNHIINNLSRYNNINLRGLTADHWKYIKSENPGIYYKNIDIKKLELNEVDDYIKNKNIELGYRTIEMLDKLIGKFGKDVYPIIDKYIKIFKGFDIEIYIGGNIPETQSNSSVINKFYSGSILKSGKYFIINKDGNYTGYRTEYGDYTNLNKWLSENSIELKSNTMFSDKKVKVKKGVDLIIIGDLFKSSEKNEKLSNIYSFNRFIIEKYKI
jgi:hypothetical protein